MIHDSKEHKETSRIFREVSQNLRIQLIYFEKWSLYSSFFCSADRELNATARKLGIETVL